MKYYDWYNNNKKNFIKKYEILKQQNKIQVYCADGTVKVFDYSKELESEIVKIMEKQVFQTIGSKNREDAVKEFEKVSDGYLTKAFFFTTLAVLYNNLVLAYHPDITLWNAALPTTAIIVSGCFLVKGIKVQSITKDILKNRLIVQHKDQLPTEVSLQNADNFSLKEIKSMIENKEEEKPKRLILKK